MAGDPQQALATAMADIATALQQLQQLQAANVAAAPPQVAPAAEGGSGGGSVIHALFDDSTPFNMASRAGSTAMQDASAILDDTWDGTVSAMPAFITSLKKRSQMAKWNAPDPNRILTYSINNVDHSLLSDFHDIPLSDLEAARIARTDPRAIQNSRAMYYCLSKSLDGDLKTILFDQESNVPTNEDGPTLFKRMMDLTIAASTQISLQALRELQDLDPSAFNYNIPLVNTRATQLFTLATTGSGKLADGERVQLMLTTYDRIKQPVAWSTWVANKTEAFDEGTTLVAVNNVPAYQLLMNQAILKSTRTKHLSVHLHHFRSHILTKTISVQHISTKEQLADMFTKPLPRDQFAKLWNRFMGWGTLDVRE